MAQRERADVLEVAVCTHCFCTDDAACEGGCSWLAVDRDLGIGVCSRCASDCETAEATMAAILRELDEIED